MALPDSRASARAPDPRHLQNLGPPIRAVAPETKLHRPSAADPGVPGSPAPKRRIKRRRLNDRRGWPTLPSDSQHEIGQPIMRTGRFHAPCPRRYEPGFPSCGRYSPSANSLKPGRGCRRRRCCAASPDGSAADPGSPAATPPPGRANKGGTRMSALWGRLSRRHRAENQRRGASWYQRRCTIWPLRGLDPGCIGCPLIRSGPPERPGCLRARLPRMQARVPSRAGFPCVKDKDQADAPCGAEGTTRIGSARRGDA